MQIVALSEKGVYGWPEAPTHLGINARQSMLLFHVSGDRFPVLRPIRPQHRKGNLFLGRIKRHVGGGHLQSLGLKQIARHRGQPKPPPTVFRQWTFRLMKSWTNADALSGQYEKPTDSSRSFITSVARVVSS